MNEKAVRYIRRRKMLFLLRRLMWETLSREDYFILLYTCGIGIDQPLPPAEIALKLGLSGSIEVCRRYHHAIHRIRAIIPHSVIARLYVGTIGV